MDELLLPVVVARLVDRDEVMDVAERALKQQVALLPLETAPSDASLHAIELYAPGLAEPLVVLGSTVGEPVLGYFPVQVQPFGDDGVEVLERLLGRGPLPSAPLPTTQPSVSSRRDGHVDARTETISSIPPMPGDGRAKMTSEPPLAGPNQLLGGKYRMEQLVGGGGMGRVYRAHHVALDKPVAVKVLRRQLQGDPQYIARFQQEALAASRIDHPNVVRVIDFGLDDYGTIYIAMELLEGKSLSEVLLAEGPLPLERIVDIMVQVCAALAIAHQHGIVHRDVKPENVLIVSRTDDDGTVKEVAKVCDFGIAQRRGANRLTGAGLLCGTAEYMAPEQAKGLDVDARADIYACGIMVYEMATGQLPFTGADALSIALAQVSQEPTPPSKIHAGVDPSLETVILKALSKDPEKRQQSARDLRLELRKLLEAKVPRGAPALQKLATLPTVSAVPQPPQVTADPSSNRRIPVAPAAMDGATSQIRAEQLAEEIAREPGPRLRWLDSMFGKPDYGRVVRAFTLAMRALGRRAEFVALADLVDMLASHAQKLPEGDAERTFLLDELRSLEADSVHEALARSHLEGSSNLRDATRRLLVRAGEAGVEAMCTARIASESSTMARARFVEVMRELAASSAAVLRSELGRAAAGAVDAAYAEDLLRAVPDALDESLGGAIVPLLAHSAAPVRRAAASAIACTWGTMARRPLGAVLRDPDEGVRIAAFTAVRRTGGVDVEVVKIVSALLADPDSSTPDLRAVAAAALAGVTTSARTDAISVLTRALEPRTKSALSFFRNAPTHDDEALTIETVARALLTIGGGDGRRLVERRATRSTGDVQRRLTRLLATARP